jgi:seryl-tRNA synthetase
MRDLRDGREVLRAQLLEQQRGNSDRRAFEAQLEGVERVGRGLNETLAAAERRARALEGEVERVKKAGQEQVRVAKAKAAQVAAQLRQSEHRVKLREAEMGKMAARLEALVRALPCRVDGCVDGRMGVCLSVFLFVMLRGG